MKPSSHTSHAQWRRMLDDREASHLSPLAAKSADGLRRQAEARLADDYRQNFAVDVDRILHSLAYTRYFDKTQVFYLINNDHITHRMLHVQLVSKAGRTIGRFLGLNEDLIEAVAIGHDIGHPPFGHDGETILSDLCVAHGIGRFHHNVQSVRFLDRVERRGRGWNLCLQTLDGILCHDGEAHQSMIAPFPEKDFNTHAEEILRKTKGDPIRLIPMTLEGCVVRLADTVSYIGRDIEDAIRLGLVQRKDLPAKSVARLGDTNGRIVFSLVTDIIQNSEGRPYAAFSPETAEALSLLKAFNYERIYNNPLIKTDLVRIKEMYHQLFERLLKELEHPGTVDPAFEKAVSGMSREYRETHGPAEMVRDFIAGMTDRYFIRQFPESLRPRSRVL